MVDQLTDMWKWIDWVRFTLKEAERETIERQKRSWTSWKAREAEEKEKEVMPDALSPNCYPILSHKVTQIQDTNILIPQK